MSRMPTNRKFLTILVATIIVGFMGYGLWVAVWKKPLGLEGRKVSMYQDSMHPWIKSDQAGKCTICGMDLTPIYEGDKGFGVGDGTVVLSPGSISVLNVQPEEVKRRPLCRTLRVAGTLEANEARRVIISAPAASRIDVLAVTYTGMEVRKGQPLITLFSPDLVQKGRVLRAAALNQVGPANDTSPAAVGSDPFSAELYAPMSGTVVERPVSVGQFVAEGEKLLVIADASVLWFRFDVYEQQLPWLEVGQRVNVVVSAVPGKVFPATISFIEPTVNDATRTVKVRADIPNPLVAANGRSERLLRFGMYAEGCVCGEIPEVIAVPRTAILSPGSAAYAYVDKGGGAYEMRRVKLGRQGDQFREVLQGLEEGDRVVTCGNVLIDAQAQFNQGSSPEAGTAVAADAGDPGGIQSVCDKMTPTAAAGTAGEAPTQSQPAAGMSAAMPPAPPAGDPAPVAAVPTKPMPEPADGAVAPQRPVTRSEKLTAFAVERENMWAMRQAALAKGQGQAMADATLLTPRAQTPTPAAPPNVGGPPAMSAPPGAMPPGAATPAPAAGTPPAPQKPLSYVKQDAARRAISEEMRKERQAAIARAQGQQAAEPPALTEAQRQALKDFVTVASDVSQALAADDFKQFNQYMARLPVVLPALQKELATSLRWAGLMQRLAAFGGEAKPAKDLDAARRQFLPFSTVTVDLAKQLRKEDPALKDLKIYHCPMAPKPGLWMQAKGPLRNPFFGSQMLTCGEEIKP
ncbi:MAG: efflux RND transporter periplasmic adaptor subunit [Planctomycetota bacterium]|nr:efflux RND transporter periplasmic adaptor subunit [Planctomycetota bacterium]